MKVRQVFGIVLLVLPAFWVCGFIIVPGYIGEPQSMPFQFWKWGVIIGVLPTLVAWGLGAWLIGEPRRLLAIGWAMIVSALLSGAMALMVHSFMSDPEWRELMIDANPDQAAGLRDMAFSIMVPLSICGAMLILGLAFLALHRWKRGIALAKGDGRPSEIGEGSRVQKRPLSVTLFACVLIVTMLVAPLSWLWQRRQLSPEVMAAATEFSGVSASVHWIWQIAGVVLTMGCAWFLLRGANWARWTLLGWLTFNVLWATLVWKNSFFLPIGVLWVAACLGTLFLHRPAAHYFRAGVPAD